MTNIINLTIKKREIKIENIFLIFILTFGTLFLLIQPIFSVPDEGNHFHSAYGIFHDDHKEEDFNRYWKEQDLESTRNGTFFQEIFIKKQDFRQNKLAFNLTFKEIQRLPQALGILIGERVYPSFGVVFFFGRLFNFILYTVLIYYAIKKAKFGKMLMATAALLPISIQQAASISYDVMFYIVFFLVFSLITNLVMMKEKLTFRWYLYIFLAVISLFIPKTSILLLGLYFVMLPPEIIGDNFLSRFINKFWSFCNRHKLLVTVTITLSIFIYIWYAFRNYGGLSTGLQVLVNTFFRADFNNTLDPIVTSGIIGAFGLMAYRLPQWLVAINFIFIFILMLNEKVPKIKLRMAVASLIIIILNMLVVAITMYRSWTVNALKQFDSLVSFGTQGRYYTPFIPCLAPIGMILTKQIKIDISPKLLRKMFISLMLFNLTFSICLIILYNYSGSGGYSTLPTFSQWLRQLIK